MTDQEALVGDEEGLVEVEMKEDTGEEVTLEVQSLVVVMVVTSMDMEVDAGEEVEVAVEAEDQAEVDFVMEGVVEEVVTLE